MTEVFVGQPLASPGSAKYLYGAVTPKRSIMVLPVIKITILTFFLEILNVEGHQNRCLDSKVTRILLNGWILPSGGVASGRVCAPAGLVKRSLILINILSKGPHIPLGLKQTNKLCIYICDE